MTGTFACTCLSTLLACRLTSISLGVSPGDSYNLAVEVRPGGIASTWTQRRARRTLDATSLHKTGSIVLLAQHGLEVQQRVGRGVGNGPLVRREVPTAISGFETISVPFDSDDENELGESLIPRPATAQLNQADQQTTATAFLLEPLVSSVENVLLEKRNKPKIGDCNIGFNNSKFGWTRAKKTWCCRRRGIGCDQSGQMDLNGSEPTRPPQHWDVSGAQICEGHGFSERACISIGCCLFDTSTRICYSAVAKQACLPSRSIPWVPEPLQSARRQRSPKPSDPATTGELPITAPTAPPLSLPITSVGEASVTSTQAPDLLNPMLSMADEEIIKEAAQAGIDEAKSEGIAVASTANGSLGRTEISALLNPNISRADERVIEKAAQVGMNEVANESAQMLKNDFKREEDNTRGGSANVMVICSLLAGLVVLIGIAICRSSLPTENLAKDRLAGLREPARASFQVPRADDEAGSYRQRTATEAAKASVVVEI